MPVSVYESCVSSIEESNAYNLVLCLGCIKRINVLRAARRSLIFLALKVQTPDILNSEEKPQDHHCNHYGSIKRYLMNSKILFFSSFIFTFMPFISLAVDNGVEFIHQSWALSNSIKANERWTLNYRGVQPGCMSGSLLCMVWWLWNMDCLLWPSWRYDTCILFTSVIWYTWCCFSIAWT